MATFTSVQDGNWSSPMTWGKGVNISGAFSGLKRFLVNPDPSTFINNGDTITVTGTVHNDGTYTVASVASETIDVVESVVDEDAGGIITDNAVPSIPQTGDDVNVDSHVTLDIVLPALSTLTLSTGADSELIGEDATTDYLSAQGQLALVAGNLTDLYVNCPLVCDGGMDGGGGTFTNVIAANSLSLTNSNITWNGGEIRSAGIVMSNNANLLATDLTCSSTAIEFNNGQFRGDCVFTAVCSVSDDTGGATKPYFGSGTFEFRDRMLLNMGGFFSGTYIAHKEFYVNGGMSFDNAPAVVHLATKAAYFVNGDAYGVTTSYAGPAGGSVGGFHIGL